MEDVVCRHIEPNIQYRGVKVTQALTGIQKVTVCTVNVKNKNRVAVVESNIGNERISVTVKIVEDSVVIRCRKRTAFIWKRIIRVPDVTKLRHKNKNAKWNNFSGFVEEAVRVLQSRLEVE